MRKVRLARLRRARRVFHGGPRRSLASFVVINLCLLCSFSRAAAADVSEYLGKPIGSVRFFLEGRETTDVSLTQVVETAVGPPLSMAQVRESVAHLFSLGRFEDVRVDAALDHGRVDLRYELSPIHVLKRIAFTGRTSAPGIDTGALRRALTDRLGAAPTVGRTAEMARMLSDALAERGYLTAQVTPRLELQHAPEQATLWFAIEPGPRTTIGAIDIVGTPSVPRGEFLRRLGLVAGAPFERARLDAGIDRYLRGRRSRGYYEAKVTSTVTLSDDRRVADLTLTVDPGPRVRVVFAGDPLPSDRRAEFVPVEREGSVDEDLLEDSSNRIEDYLRNLGHRDAKAPHTRVQADGELVITFTVTKGPEYRVASLAITGNTAVPLASFAASLRLREGQLFSDRRLEADAAMIEDLYHRRGFPTATARGSTRVEATPNPAARVGVAVGIDVLEGALATVEDVTLSGNQSIPEPELRARIATRAGAVFVPAQLVADRDAVEMAYRNAGFETVNVDARSTDSPDHARVKVAFTIREGPQVFVDHVLIVGNVRTSTATIERALRIKPGDPLGLQAVNDSQRRLSALGLFRRVRISELAHGVEARRDLLVTVEEGPTTTLGYGGGGEIQRRVVHPKNSQGPAVERLEFAPRLFGELGLRNLFGGNRSLNLFGSVALRRNAPGLTSAGMPTDFGLTEFRVIATFREPRLFDTATDALLNGTFERQIRSGFAFERQSGGAQLARRLSRAWSATGVYQLERTELLVVSVSPQEQPFVDRVFATVRLSSFTVSGIRDTRDDAANPRSGHYFSASGQVAGRTIGSDVGFVKTFFTAQTFRAVPRPGGVIFAGNARLGLARGFPRDVVTGRGEADEPIVTREVKDLPEPQRFFAGGDTTARGFALDTLGRPETVKGGFPIGGNALVLFNGEMRVPVAGGSQVVGFLDTGNVFARVADIDLAELRTSVGFGFRVRVRSLPLIRFDWGFKTNRQPGEDRGAWFISIGQAF